LRARGGSRTEDRRPGPELYQGLADPIVTPAMTLDYYEAVESKSGDHGAPSSFLRLFMLPGLDHCGAQPGSGADRRGFDPLTALEPWVEHGVPPTMLLTVGS
jgi:Tannase and feruloyl esterase